MEKVWLNECSSYIVHGKFWHRKKLTNLVNRKLFVKIFLTSGASEMYLGYALTVAYLQNFSSPIAFTCIGFANIHPAKIFLCMVTCFHIIIYYQGMHG